MKRGILVTIPVLTLALLAGALVWWAIAPDPMEGLVTEVRPGMTQADVEALLNKPDFAGPPGPNGSTISRWVTDRVVVVAVFDRSGRLTTTFVDRRSLWDRIQDFRRK